MERAELKALVEATGAAEKAGGIVFLAESPRSPAEAARRREMQLRADRRPPGAEGGWLAIATGGTGGGLRFACMST